MVQEYADRLDMNSSKEGKMSSVDIILIPPPSMEVDDKLLKSL